MWVKDLEVSDEECPSGTWKKNEENASFKMSHSRQKKAVYPHSVTIREAKNPQEVKAVDTLRQALISDNLLPEMLDDYHMMLR